MKPMTAQKMQTAEKQISRGMAFLEDALDNENAEVRAKLELISEQIREGLFLLEITLNEAGYELDVKFE